MRELVASLGIDAALSQAVAAVLWLGLRLLPMVVLSPWLALRAGPSWLTLLLGVGSVVSLLPTVMLQQAALPSTGVPALLAGVLPELLRGTLLALGASLPLYAFAWTGRLCDALRQAGVLPDEADSPLGTLFEAAALAVFFASGAHLLVYAEVVGSLHAFPLGSPWSHDAARGVLVPAAELVVRAFSLAVTLAAPVLLSVLVAALGLGLLARVHAQLSAALLATDLVPLLGLAAVLLGTGRALADGPQIVEVFVAQARALLSTLR